jgi:hypothetical protein
MKKFKLNNGAARMRASSYTDEEVDKYILAISIRDETMLDSLPCRCNKMFKCEVCHLREIRAEMDKKKLQI